MRFRAHLEGFSDLARKLQELQERAEDPGVGDRALLAEFLTADFMRAHTGFTSLEEMFQESGYVIESEEDLERIPDETWDAYVERNTDFASWEEMVKSALKAWAKGQLGV